MKFYRVIKNDITNHYLVQQRRIFSKKWMTFDYTKNEEDAIKIAKQAGKKLPKPKDENKTEVLWSSFDETIGELVKTVIGIVVILFIMIMIIYLQQMP